MSANCRRASARPASKLPDNVNLVSAPPALVTASAEPPQEATSSAEASELSMVGQGSVLSPPSHAHTLHTYTHLIEFHLERIRFDEHGNQRSRAVLKNNKSIIRSWAKRQAKRRGLTLHVKGEELGLPVGEELGTDFLSALADYQTDEELKGRKKGTVADRMSVMRSVRESAVQMIKLDGLPAEFTECLKSLIKSSGKTGRKVARAAGVSARSLYNWMDGTYEPCHRSKPVIQRLEQVLNVPAGTLTGRLPSLEAFYVSGLIPSGTTEWRQHHKKMVRLKYCLTDKEFSPLLNSELGDLLQFHTSTSWLIRRRLKRNSEWRKRPNGKCAGEHFFREHCRRFFGWLRLPADADDPWLRGMGIPNKVHSLALLSDADLVISSVEFKRERTYLRSYNNGTLAFLSKCAALLRKGTGFLRQQPKYGGRLPNPIPPKRWDKWCESNRERILEFRKGIKASRNDPVIKTRDPFAAVREFIMDRDDPLDVLMEIADNMRRRIPVREKGAPGRFAVFMRDLTFGEFASSYPLRVENFTWLKWIPKDPAALLKRFEKFQQTKKLSDLIDPEQKYIETEEGSHLYQKRDGSFWIRFAGNEVKNNVEIDVPVAKSVAPTLLMYLIRHRIVLNRELKQAINQRREKEGMPLLTPDEERAIDYCPFVFRPNSSGVFSMKPDAFAKYTGAEQLENKVLSDALYCMSRRYLRNCKGFRPHAIRHLVASQYIKNHPNGYAEAAAALNITVEIVKKHYSWVPPCARLKPWHDEFEAVRSRFESSRAA